MDFNEKLSRIGDMHVLKENLGVVGGQGNCALAAVAIITGKHIDHVTAVAKKLGNKRGHWKGSVSFQLLYDIMTHFNIKYKDCNWLSTRNTTLRKWVMSESEPNKKYLVITTGHVQIVESGIVVDQNNTCLVSDYFGRNKRLKKIFEIKSEE